ncbi:MAG: hypothetical protein U5L72_10145 [Bacteroidales bacterium]|nr:hypothetical protein [Bacteroidales bacterium]
MRQTWDWHVQFTLLPVWEVLTSSTSIHPLMQRGALLKEGRITKPRYWTIGQGSGLGFSGTTEESDAETDETVDERALDALITRR